MRESTFFPQTHTYSMLKLFQEALLHPMPGSENVKRERSPSVELLTAESKKRVKAEARNEWGDLSKVQVVDLTDD